MAYLQNYPTYTQAVPTSCWACAARSILNYNYGLPAQPIQSDQDLADDWATVTNDPAHADLSVMQSASGALEDLGFKNQMDELPIPTMAELEAEIGKNRPLLAIIGAQNPNGQPNPRFQGGHWLVIVGADHVSGDIAVFDPQTGGITTVAYNAATYGGYPVGNFWENTSYFETAAT